MTYACVRYYTLLMHSPNGSSTSCPHQQHMEVLIVTLYWEKFRFTSKFLGSNPSSAAYYYSHYYLSASLMNSVSFYLSIL